MNDFLLAAVILSATFMVCWTELMIVVWIKRVKIDIGPKKISVENTENQEVESDPII